MMGLRRQAARLYLVSTRLHRVSTGVQRARLHLLVSTGVQRARLSTLTLHLVRVHGLQQQ